MRPSRIARGGLLRLGVTLFVGALAHLALGAYACADPVGSTKVEGEPCTRTIECAAGLSCSAGVCRALDASTPPLDAGPDDASTRDASTDGAATDAASTDDASTDAATDDAAAGDADTADADTEDAATSTDAA